MSVDPINSAATPAPLARRPAHITHPDALYGAVRISRWAATLLETPPFQRLAGVSLSDVPGELLFGHPFSSRLDHALGVYHLARQARPRDRALQAAALAHDLGHGPFSHATETLMRERLGIDHEQRSVRVLGDVRAALTAAARRLLAWLDWDEVARLIMNESPDGRGALLNGLLDYDNAEYVARFLHDGRIARPGYHPEALARGLRFIAPPVDTDAGTVYLLPGALDEARAWQRDRATLYAFLQEGHTDVALHAMLRKTIDLAAQAHLMHDSFFDLTDAGAFRLLTSAREPQVARLARRVASRVCYECVWEAEVPDAASPLAEAFQSWRGRLTLEARLASEAGLAPEDLVLDLVTSAARRELPPLLSPQQTPSEPEPPSPPQRIAHLLVAPGTARDYLLRLGMAATRLLGPMGARPRETSPGS